MRNLQRAIVLIAGIFVFADPCTAKVVKFEIVRVESPAFEGRSFGAVGTYDRILARATIAIAVEHPPPSDHIPIIGHSAPNVMI